ncbi:MAG TPA: hypothetical protein VJ739_00250 [Gemmataceae bacterium]|nr:hypothetical protein [Gemmataceae bacterium]
MAGARAGGTELPRPPGQAAHQRYSGHATDPLYQVTTYTYDAGALTRAVDAGLGGVTTYTYTYDGAGGRDGWHGEA